MKTVQDLRDFITENGGDVEIGFLRMSYSGGDIDIYFINKLCNWLRSDTVGTELINKVRWSEVTEIQEMYEKSARVDAIATELETVKRDANKTIEELVNKVTETKEGTRRIEGQLEVYEKLLTGRTVTLAM